MATIQSIERAFIVLDVVSVQPKAGNISSIAKKANLPRTTVNRLLITLQAIGAIERVPETDHYRVGPRILSLAARVPYRQHLISVARPCLQELALQTGEAAYLSLPDGNQVQCVDQINSQHHIQLQDWTGYRAPMHTAAAGLVFLATWSAEQLNHYLAQPLERYTDKTMTDPVVIQTVLAKVKTQGYAWSREQTEIGLNGVAAPIRGKSGQVVAAISTGGPIFRFPPASQKDKIIQQVITFANKISDNL